MRIILIVALFLALSSVEGRALRAGRGENREERINGRGGGGYGKKAGRKRPGRIRDESQKEARHERMGVLTEKIAEMALEMSVLEAEESEAFDSFSDEDDESEGDEDEEEGGY